MGFRLLNITTIKILNIKLSTICCNHEGGGK